MKCPNCAAVIGMEDKFCPYCGTPNPFAVRHQQELENYERSYESVKAKVTEKSRRAASLTAPAVLMAVLILMNVAAALFVHSSWDIASKRISRQMSLQMDEYRADLDRYLSERDYGSYSGYYYANQLYLCDELDDIRPVERAASAFDRIFEETMRFKRTSAGKAPEEITEKLNETAGTIADGIAELYAIESDYGYDRQKYLTKPNLDAIRKIRTDAEIFLRSWYSLNEDDCVMLPALSKAGIKELIIRRTSGE